MSIQAFAVTVVLWLSLSLVQSAEQDVKPKIEQPAVQSDQDSMGDIDIMSAMSDCNETFRIDMSFLLALNESGSFPDETDRTPKCYVRCVLEMVDIASADGQFDPERSEAALMSIRGVRLLSNIKETATSCAADRKETCKCERSYQFIKCLMEMEIKMAE